ncbi:aminoacyl-tRNA hydrolase [bacterium DOLZORAL124_64_63]|nr:MAG: aminoacyl-tRNA hydrolase [bacterium DOLZORAL124_64_63]
MTWGCLLAERMRKLIVGLGNPGRRYQDNRHNIGFLVVDELLRRRGLNLGEDRREYLATAEAFGPRQPVLLKPLTYMNLSGEAVAAWAERAGEHVSGAVWPPPVAEPPAGDPLQPVSDPDPGPEPFRPLVICDDLALPLGAVRLRGKGSSGGQNGVQSVIEHIGGEIFPRLRLGIAPPGETVPPALWPDYVLADFAPEEHAIVAEVVGHAADAVEFWLEQGTEATGSRFNRKRSPVED